MHIQWFPGHMTKAMRMMEECVRLVDAGVIVLDARAPYACVNRKIENLFGTKPVIYAVNKCDLVKESDLKRVIADFKNHGKTAVAVNALDKKSVAKLYKEITFSLADKLEKNKQKGIFKPMRVMISGIPNTGKSTLINTFAGEKKAVTGDKAGVTRGKQWIRLYDIELLDTPGTMPPSFDDQTLAKYLAFIGSINDDILDFEELTLELISTLKEKYPEVLTEKYGITDFSLEPLEMYGAICKRRGFLLRGGEFDYERCSKAVIDDFRKGRIGKIMLV